MDREVLDVATVEMPDAAKVEALDAALRIALPRLVVEALDALKVALAELVADLSDAEWETLKREEDQRRGDFVHGLTLQRERRVAGDDACGA